MLDFSHLHSRDRANPRVIEPQGSSKAQLLRQLSRSILFLPSVLARISHQRRRTHLLLEQTCRQRLPGVVINNQTQPNQRKVLYFSSPPLLRFSLFPFHLFYVFVVFRPPLSPGKIIFLFRSLTPPRNTNKENGSRRQKASKPRVQTNHSPIKNQCRLNHFWTRCPLSLSLSPSRRIFFVSFSCFDPLAGCLQKALPPFLYIFYFISKRKATTG